MFVLLILVQGVNRLLWAGWAARGRCSHQHQLLSRGPGAEADTRATRAADTCMCQLVHVAVSTRESRVS